MEEFDLSNMYSDYEKSRKQECRRPTFVSSKEDSLSYERPCAINTLKDEDIEALFLKAETEFCKAACKHLKESILSMMLDELDIVTELSEGERLVLLARTNGNAQICTEDECMSKLDHWIDYTEIEFISEELLLVSYNPDDVITLGKTRYVSGDIVIVEIDENGNECSVNEKTLRHFLEFRTENLTQIEADGNTYPVFRLDWLGGSNEGI